MLLHQPRDGIQVARASMRSDPPPSRKRGPCGFDRRVNVRRRPLRHRCKFLSVRRIDGVEVLSRRGRLPSAADEMLEAVAMTLQPCRCFFRIFWSGPILHAHELFGNAHLALARFLLSDSVEKPDHPKFARAVSGQTSRLSNKSMYGGSVV